MKSEIRREMDQLNKRFDQIDKQVSMILQLLTAGSVQAPATSQRHAGGHADSSSTDKKIPRAVHSPSFMDTIAEQEEDITSLLEATSDIGNEEKQWNKNSTGRAAHSSLNDLDVL